MKKTTITTTADLYTDKLRIEHLNLMADYIKESIVEIHSCYGKHKYIWKNNEWVRCVIINELLEKS